MEIKTQGSQRICNSMQSRQNMLAHMKKIIAQLTFNNDHLEKSIETAQSLTIKKFISFFPVTKGDNIINIVNIDLPLHGDYSLMQNHAVATAMGHVVNIISRLANYLNICLPYTMECKGSQSLIWEIETDKKILFWVNHPQEMEKALMMLNVNISYLSPPQGFGNVAVNLYKLLSAYFVENNSPSSEGVWGSATKDIKTVDPYCISNSPANDIDDLEGFVMINGKK